MWLTDSQKIGRNYATTTLIIPVALDCVASCTTTTANATRVGLTSFGAFFMLLGVIMLFDGPLIALGNILFVSGLPLIIGPRKTFYFFARKNKLRGSVSFIAGIVLVFLKYPFFGVIIEMFGFLNLFGDFFPVVLSFMRQLPVIGHFLSAPGVRQVTDRLCGVRKQSPV